ncbi:DNA cytosine methyltransferase [Chryseobacterium camelliae]|uniref:DNA cytosine methyltransferase n=1 Tax=Chryseobacterium camelliae TaxID=1265445 RepID=UPI002859DD8B|nr:DNA (cytosine-5-)-methyltransferase [Chryseobacterium camelliae]MDR6515854.1 DNA (cytosine-5)-methyltransferase 1 [Chryseobacterium camelliae]
MRFIDLFAGIGGFHQALESLGHTCVFASEKKENLAKLYFKNYGIEVNRNIRRINPYEIPDHEILCGGFPCQPFSKAGNQKGLFDPNNGSFFDIIVEILRVKQPNYFILENVRNLESHDEYRTWNYILERLEELGYSVDKKVMSPHQYNIPQHRERLFIVGSRSGLDHFNWPLEEKKTLSIHNFLNESNPKLVEEEKLKVIDVWQEFISVLPKNKKLPGFPIWATEFGATYPVKEIATNRLSSAELDSFKGSFGIELKGLSLKDKHNNLPPYSLNSKTERFPNWKIRYIEQNRKLYEENKTVLDPIVSKIKEFPIFSWQKFEWNCGELPRDLYKYIIQFRASGVRIKNNDFFPSLVTVSTQIPIIGWQKRYLSPAEGAAIQSFEKLYLPENLGSSFGALGNAVNVKLVRLIANNLLNVDIQHENTNIKYLEII